MTQAPRDFYDTTYHFANDVTRPDESRIRRSLRFLGNLEGLSHLDLGCGGGWAARLAHLEGRTRHTLGLDFSRTALTLARQHTPQILWVQADGAALPIANDSIDRLFCDGALEHFPSPAKGWQEIARILRRGSGRAVVIVPNFYVRTEQPLEFRTNYWGWKKLIQTAGLTLEETHVDWGPPLRSAGSPMRAAKRFAGKVLGVIPFLQYQFVFVVTKRV
jgi:ubiquinone/menaquinone biosynthesis C-methylase UbiE